MSTYDTEYRGYRGEGWVFFAGVMIVIAGALNLIYGIAAIGSSDTFLENSRFVVFHDLSAWGWIHTIIGMIQLIAAFAIWDGREFGRVIGVISAAVSAIAILLFANALPFVAFAIFIIDVLVIYGLVAYGGRRSGVLA